MNRRPIGGRRPETTVYLELSHCLKQTVSQVVNDFVIVYGTRRLTVVFSRMRHWTTLT